MRVGPHSFFLFFSSRQNETYACAYHACLYACAYHACLYACAYHACLYAYAYHACAYHACLYAYAYHACACMLVLACMISKKKAYDVFSHTLLCFKLIV
jgi:hypothetical protein